MDSDTSSKQRIKLLESQLDNFLESLKVPVSYRRVKRSKADSLHATWQLDIGVESARREEWERLMLNQSLLGMADWINKHAEEIVFTPLAQPKDDNVIVCCRGRACVWYAVKDGNYELSIHFRYRPNPEISMLETVRSGLIRFHYEARRQATVVSFEVPDRLEMDLDLTYRHIHPGLAVAEATPENFHELEKLCALLSSTSKQAA